MKIRLWVRILLSVFLIYHLSAVLIIPNPESVLHRNLAWIFSPYVNLIGLNNTWRFFSPNPLIRLVEYEARSFDEDGQISRDETHRFPDGRESVKFRESYNRRLNFAMMVSARDETLTQILAPYICKKHDWATEISFFLIEREFPTLENSHFLGRDREDLAKIKRHLIKDVSCKEIGT